MCTQGRAERSRAGLTWDMLWVAGLIAMQQCLALIQPAFGLRVFSFDALCSLDSSCQSMQFKMRSKGAYFYMPSNCYLVPPAQPLYKTYAVRVILPPCQHECVHTTHASHWLMMSITDGEAGQYAKC